MFWSCRQLNKLTRAWSPSLWSICFATSLWCWERWGIKINQDRWSCSLTLSERDCQLAPLFRMSYALRDIICSLRSLWTSCVRSKTSFCSLAWCDLSHFTNNIVFEYLAPTLCYGHETTTTTLYEVSGVSIPTIHVRNWSNELAKLARSHASSNNLHETNSIEYTSFYSSMFSPPRRYHAAQIDRRNSLLPLSLSSTDTGQFRSCCLASSLASDASIRQRLFNSR